MKLKIKEGTTSKLCRLFIQDSSSTTGAGLTGLAYNTSGIQAHYIREGGTASVQIGSTGGLGNLTTLGTWVSGGLKEVSSSNMPGVYEFGLPDAAIASGAGSAVVMLHGAANMVPVLLEVELDKIDYRSASYANLEASAGTIIKSTATSGSHSLTTMITNLTEATDDHFNGRVLIFTDNALSGQATNITDYNGTTKTLTFSQLTDTPASGQGFVIV
jgi:hypothetical protein